MTGEQEGQPRASKPELDPIQKTGPARMRLTKRLRNYFLAGILVIAPITITFWLAWKFVTFIDDQVRPLIPPGWNPETYLPFALPGFGIVIAAIALTLVGVLAAGYSGRFLMDMSERLVARVPVARSVYSWTKQLFETVLSQKSTAFREVVLVEFPRRGMWAIGFLTGRTVGEVQELTDSTVFNVFIPATPNPTTGFLLFIPNRDIQHLDMTVEEGIKLVISGGIVVPEKPTAAEAIRNIAVAKGKPKSKGWSRITRFLRLRFLRRLRNYFFAGILVTAPISITIWLAWGFVSFVDDKVTPLIPPSWNPETYLPFSIPGLGVVLLVTVLTAVGFLAAGLAGRTLVGIGERILDRMPVIRNVYSALKQVFETVLKEQSQAFRDCVLIQYPRPESWAIGFITGETEAHIQHGTPHKVVNVFLPTTPNPTSGFLLFVPRDEIQLLTMTVEEGIKMVVSGGIVTPTERNEKDAADEPGEEEPEVAKSA